jgi:hypothetical protein
MDNFSITFSAILGVLTIFNAVFWLKLWKFGKLFQLSQNEENQKISHINTQESLKKLDKDVQELYEINSRLNKIAKRGICKVGMLKFNAFSEKSGNQSFALALLDFRDNGVILTNLQTNQGSRFFIKSIKHGESDNGSDLLKEEIKSLEKAKQVVF